MAKWFNRRFRVGVAGCDGQDTKSWIRALLDMTDEGVEVVAVADSDLGKAQSFASRLGVRRALGSLEEMIRRMTLDGVVVTLPPAGQAEATTYALEHGLHAFCELPFGRSAQEAWQMLQAKAGSWQVLAVGNFYAMQNRWSQEFVKGEGIGVPRLLEATWQHQTSDGFHRGISLDLATRLLLTGLPLLSSPPLAVTAVGWNRHDRVANGDDFGAGDTLSVVVDCENGARGQFIAASGPSLARDERLLRCYGTKGLLVMPLLAEGDDVAAFAPTIVSPEGMGRRAEPPIPAGEALAAQLRNWARRAWRAQEPLVSASLPEYVLYVHRVLDTVKRSAALGGQQIVI